VNDRVISAWGMGPLLNELAAALPRCEGAVVLSADGLVLETSAETDPMHADRLAAVAAGLHAIADAANRNNGGVRVSQTVVEMDFRMMVVLPVTGEAILAVVFDAVHDLSGVREQIARFAARLSRRIDGDLVASV
jgi:predicted regulator of Ras-like GTPase activity (Roadblock/LC7/MglB family)